MTIWMPVDQLLHNPKWNRRLQIRGFVSNGSALLLTHTGIHISSHISSLSTACCASLSPNGWTRGREREQEKELCVYAFFWGNAVLIRGCDEERWLILDGKLCPEERGPTEIVLPSSWLPTGSCDRDSVKMCPIGNEKFSVCTINVWHILHWRLKWNCWCAWHFLKCVKELHL